MASVYVSVIQRDVMGPLFSTCFFYYTFFIPFLWINYHICRQRECFVVYFYVYYCCCYYFFFDVCVYNLIFSYFTRRKSLLSVYWHRVFVWLKYNRQCYEKSDNKLDFSTMSTLMSWCMINLTNSFKNHRKTYKSHSLRRPTAELKL